MKRKMFNLYTKKAMTQIKKSIEEDEIMVTVTILNK